MIEIRAFRIGDETALRDVFYSAVHEVASRDYTAQQIDAWAPRAYDAREWATRMRAIRPFVVERSGQIVAYADVQPDGYIDHFYVSGACAKQGIGSRLMNHLHEVADAQGVDALTSHVSRTAQPFFARFGFIVVELRSPVQRGVVVPNALMRKRLRPRA